MIRDAENTFCKDLDLTAQTATATYSDVINVGGGDAVNQMYLYVGAPKALQDGTLTLVLQTSDKEDFPSDNTNDLGTYTISKDKGEKVKARLPIGCKKYLRLKLSATLDASKTKIGAGLLTAFLTYDVNI